MAHLIDGPGSVGGSFVGLDVQTGQQPTQVTVDWAEMVNRELVNLVEGAGITPDKAINNQLLQAVLALSGQSLGNRLNNGLFRIWQRRAEPSPTQTIDDTDGAVVIPDRWWFEAGTGGSPSLTVSREVLPDDELPPGSTVFGQFPHFCRVDQTAAASTTEPLMTQRIENARTLAGVNVVLSVSMRIPSGSPSSTVNVVPRLIQHFGTGGTPSSPVVYDGPTIAVSGTTWVRYSWTTQLSVITGKTFGTDENSRLEVQLEFPTGQTHTVDLLDFRLEPGTAVGTDYPTFAEDFYACQRYYQTSFADTSVPAHGASDGHEYLALTGDPQFPYLIGTNIPFPVGMYRIPECFIYHPTSASPSETGAAGSMRTGNASATIVDEGVSSCGATKQRLGPITPSSWDTGSNDTNWVQFHWTADAEIIDNP